MAKKNTTPASITNAPEPEPVTLIKHTGLNREQRRRLHKRLRSRNTPYRKAEGA